MLGTVVAISSLTGMVVVKTDEGDYSVIELIGGYDPELGDRFKGNLTSEGSEDIINVSQSEKMDAYVQGVFSNREAAVAMIRG